MTDYDEFERRLAAAIRSDADVSVGLFTPESIARAAIADTGPGTTRIRRSSRHARRSGRARGMTLLAAAALLIVGGALAAGSGLVRLPTVVPPVPEPSVVAVATASPDATSPSPSESAAPSASPIPAAGPGGVWIATGTMGTPRFGHIAVRLLDGRVLVVGGGENDTSAELYDPDSGTWSATGSLAKPLADARVRGTAVLLRDGKVLVRVADDADDPIRGAEVYDPATGTWTPTGQMVQGADYIGDTATVLQDGKVLVAGMNGAQLYDQTSGTWSATGKRTIPSYYAAATRLSDGRVLVAGGFDFDSYEDSAELYDPDTGSWTAIANMHAKGPPIAAFAHPDGKVLVVGSGSVEVFDPATGAWTRTGPDTALNHWSSTTLLSDGRLMVSPLDDPTSAALYDADKGTWAATAPMLRSHETPAIPLLDGTVLVAGGRDCQDDVCVSTGSAELYVPAGVSPPPLPAFPGPPPPVIPSPTPMPTPFPPTAGPVPPNARSWKVTVDNESSEPVTLFVAEFDENGMTQLVGSATPNVVPAGAAVKVTFLFPAKGDPHDGWIFVNPRPGDGGPLVGARDIGIPGEILMTADGQVVWSSP